MAERWQSSEGRVAAAFWRDSNGAPVLGLTPSASTLYKDGTAAPAATVAEVGLGFYRVTFAAALTKDCVARLDGGVALTTTRYVALEVPVGGYVDSIDAALSSRATQASVTALGAPSQAADGRFANLDATISSRATQTSVTALGSPAQASALATAQAAITALGTPAQASALTALSSAVTALGTPAQASALAALATAVGTPAQAAVLASDLAILLAAIAAVSTSTPSYTGGIS